MSEYVIPSATCQEQGRAATGAKSREQAKRPGGAAGSPRGEALAEPTSSEGRGLVSSPISEQRTPREPLTFEVYPRSLRVRRPYHGPVPTPPARSGSTLQGFSDKSRGRLRFTAANAGHLTAQFCCTYHEYWPVDGRQFKRHLHAFLIAAGRAFPFLEYLWVAEFQTRGAPHAHVYLNVPVSDENRATLAAIWCRIVQPGNPSLLAFHDHPKNFIRWDMGTGSYLCKYLDKSHQKAIPDGFRSFGRWWGNSRGLVPPPEQITSADLDDQFPQVDEETGEVHEHAPAIAVQLVRLVGRYHEKQNRRSWFRRTNKTTLALTGAPVFRQALAYFHRIRGNSPDPSPF